MIQSGHLKIEIGQTQGKYQRSKFEWFQNLKISKFRRYWRNILQGFKII